MASPKKNVNKNDPNQKNNVKQVKPRESGYCETKCSEVGSCEKYREYIEKMINGKRGYGLNCSK